MDGCMSKLANVWVMKLYKGCDDMKKRTVKQQVIDTLAGDNITYSFDLWHFIQLNKLINHYNNQTINLSTSNMRTIPVIMGGYNATDTK